MEKHLKILEKICRVCKHPIIFKAGYINPKAAKDFNDIFEENYNISVTSESSDVQFAKVHPVYFLVFKKS